jgi:nitroreductase
MPEDDKINRILEAARLAPTWANRQGMHYIIVNDKKLIKAVWEAIGQKQKFIDSPIFIVGLIAESGSGANRTEKYYPIDFGICFEHLILAATAEGLGTCWIGLFDEIRIKEILGIPTKYRVLGITPLGYPVKQKGEIKDRKPLKDFIHYNNF